jgi:hypothetical protein
MSAIVPTPVLPDPMAAALLDRWTKAKQAQAERDRQAAQARQRARYDSMRHGEKRPAPS